MLFKDKISRFVGLLAVVLLTAPVSVVAETEAEVAVKAAVVHKIAKFVVWPDSAFGSDDAPMRFCVVEHQMMFDALRELDGRSIHGRPILVTDVQDPVDTANSCEVLYMGSSKDQQRTDWYQAIADNPILTFGEAGANNSAGNIVNVSIRRDKVRFNINTEASDRAGLRISAQLLQLAAALGGGG
ncbi:MAG: YfiR family protein [Woeseiaceae bacterium]